jgi:hypothetical protein
MGEEVPEPAGWTTRERTLAATAGVIALLIVVLLGVAVLPRADAEPATADVSPTVAPRTSGTAEPSPDPSPTPTPTPSPTPTATDVAEPSSGFTADGLADLTSYRFAVRIDGSGSNSPLVPIEGTVEVGGIVTTEPKAIDVVVTNMVGPNSSVRIVAIGSEAWVDTGAGTLVAAEGREADSARQAIQTYQPENLFRGWIGELPPDAILVGTTIRAGVTVDEYRIDQTAIEGAGGDVLMEGSFALHDELGVPVWVEVLFTSVDDPAGTYRVSLELFDLNDPSVQVVHP